MHCLFNAHSGQLPGGGHWAFVAITPTRPQQRSGAAGGGAGGAAAALAQRRGAGQRQWAGWVSHCGLPTLHSLFVGKGDAEQQLLA